MINGRTKQRVDKAVEELEQQGQGANVSGIAADFSKADEVQNSAKQFPSVDILINNVSIFERKPFAEISDNDWLRFYEINVLSGISLSRHYFQQMIKTTREELSLSPASQWSVVSRQ